VARCRDVRRFERGPYVLKMRRGRSAWGEGIPYDVPAVPDRFIRAALDA
jgi:hypothetical protein